MSSLLQATGHPVAHKADYGESNVSVMDSIARECIH